MDEEFSDPLDDQIIICINKIEFICKKSIITSISSLVKKRLFMDSHEKILKFEINNSDQFHDELDAILNDKSFLLKNHSLCSFLDQISQSFGISNFKLLISIEHSDEILIKTFLKYSKEFQLVDKCYEILNSLTNQNIEQKILEAKQFMEFYDDFFTFSRMILTFCYSRSSNIDLYINFAMELPISQLFCKIAMNEFINATRLHYSDKTNIQETCVIIHRLIIRNVYKEAFIVKKAAILPPFFAHLLFPKDIEAMNEDMDKTITIKIKNMLNHHYDEHIFNMDEGYNENKIAVVIRKDKVNDLENLLESFDINSQIEQSYYERSTIINNNPTLLEYAIFYKSSQCVNLLLSKGATFTKQTVKYASSAGNLELIIKYLKNETSESILSEATSLAIKYHHLHVVDYFIHNFKNCINHKCFEYCIKYGNSKSLQQLLIAGFSFNDFIVPSFKFNNYTIMKLFTYIKGINFSLKDRETSVLYNYL